jgi:hypothetical protein
VWHNKDPSLLKDHKYRPWPYYCNSSPAIVMTRYERKILEKEVKLYTTNTGIKKKEGMKATYTH